MHAKDVSEVDTYYFRPRSLLGSAYKDPATLRCSAESALRGEDLFGF